MTPELSNFEEEVCNYTGSKHCIGLNSGTDALMMALWSLGVGKNDEVITSPISFVATANSIIHVGAKPVFIDVDEDLNINPNLILFFAIFSLSFLFFSKSSFFNP